MKVLDSGALRGLTKILGIAGGTPTDFDDGNLQQTLDVGPILRRSRTPGELNGGIFSSSIRNTHTAANVLLGTLAPYTCGVGATAPARNTWPGVGQGVPDIFDLWLLGVDAQNRGTPGQFGGAQLAINIGAQNNAELAVTVAAGVSVRTGALVFTIRTYDVERGIGALETALDEGAGHLSRLPLPLRIPRGASLLWGTESTGAGNPIYDVHLLFGVFPAGFGQDFATGAV